MKSTAQGSSVLVTGASSGIGQATAQRLDREGFRVFAGIRRSSDGEALRASASPRLTPVLLDVIDQESIAAAARQVDEATGEGGLQGLVNNAGIVISGILEFADIDQLRNQLEVNLIGNVAVTRAFLPAIRRAEGRIVNISADTGLLAPPFFGPYSVSKWGLEAVSDALRRELRPWGIQVVIIEPGATRSAVTVKGVAQANAVRGSLQPEGERLYGEMYANTQQYIASQPDRAMPADKVAEVIHRALTTRHPRIRYRVGIDAKTAFLLSRFFPARLVDAFIARYFK